MSDRETTAPALNKLCAKTAAADDPVEEDASKDAFFVQIAEIAEAMIARHGKDFAIGALVLSAKFIAEGKPLINRNNGGGETVSTVKPV